MAESRGKIDHDSANKGLLPVALVRRDATSFRLNEELIRNYNPKMQNNQQRKKTINQFDSATNQMVATIDQAESLIVQSWRFVATAKRQGNS